MDRHQDDQAANPYSSPIEVTEDKPVVVDREIKQTTFVNAFGRWTLICIGAATPSFVFGLMVTGGGALGVIAMLLGVLTASVIYAVVDMQTYWRKWMSQRLTRLAIITAFTIRILVSVIIPIGGVNDVACGMISVASVAVVFGGSASFDATESTMGPFQVYSTTLFQGVLLSVEVFVVGLCVLGIIFLWDRFVPC